MSESLDQEKEEATPEEQPKKKHYFLRVKESADEQDELFHILAGFIRLGVLLWSGAILTIAYVELPEEFNIPKQNLDPTFIASVFTATLATFGVTNGRRGHSGYAITKQDLEKLIENAAQIAPSQVIKLEQSGFVLVPKDQPKDGPPIAPPTV